LDQEAEDSVLAIEILSSQTIFILDNTRESSVLRRFLSGLIPSIAIDANRTPFSFKRFLLETIGGFRQQDCLMHIDLKNLKI
jgi:hypothetical protein